MATPQTERWEGQFGREYTDRSVLTPQELDQQYLTRYGTSRSELNRRFLEGVPSSARILEVGCNVGNQLLLLQEMGYRNLYGIELQRYAVEKAHSRLQNITVELAPASQIPYPDSNFDLVFTSGVLIHIAPSDLPKVMAEIGRCARLYIWGLEYYSPQMRAVRYRGEDDLLWKANYADLYLRQFTNLNLVREQKLEYLTDDNQDSMFLLKKLTSH